MEKIGYFYSGLSAERESCKNIKDRHVSKHENLIANMKRYFP